MNVIADHLANHVVKVYGMLKFNFSDKDMLSVKEGKSDYGCCGNKMGAVLMFPNKKQYPVLVKS